MIVSHLPEDRDLYNLSCSCATFASALVPETSAIWKERFLSRYDYPFVDDSTQFAFAYQLRRAVLRQFVELTNPNDPRLAVQMEVMRDMVIGMVSIAHFPSALFEADILSFRGLQLGTNPTSLSTSVKESRSILFSA